MNKNTIGSVTYSRQSSMSIEKDTVMRKNVFNALMLVLLIALMMGTAFAQKTTIDPNTLPKVDADKPDSRLEQKITYSAKQKAVSAILADLTKQTGVTLKAGINEKDWQVRDRKMNIFAKDTQLKDIMDSISRVMKFMWASGGKGDTRTYRLFMDRKTLLDAESQRMREEERQAKEAAEKRKNMLKEYGSLDNLSKEDLAKLKEERPLEYIAVTSGIGPSLKPLFEEVPMALEAIVSGTSLTMNGSQMSPKVQNGLLQASVGTANLMESFGVKDMAVPDDMAANMDKVTVTFNKNIEQMNSSLGAGVELGEMSLSYGGKNYDFPLLDPTSKFANFIGRMIIKSKEEGRPINELDVDMQAEVLEFVTDAMKALGGEAAPKHPDDSALDVKVKLNYKGKRLYDCEKALHEVSSFAIVSDSFGSSNAVGGVANGSEMKIKDVLEKIGTFYNYNWEKRGNTLELRDRKWYHKRAVQIPDAWLDAWKKTLKETGTLDLGDLAQIAALSAEQIDMNISSDEDLSRCGIQWRVLNSRDLLKLYATLTDSQRAAIFIENGLNLRTLTADQWALAETMINQRNSAMLLNKDAQLTLSGSQTAVEKTINYSFTLSSSADMPLISFNITTPAYVEPPKEKTP